MPSKAATNRPRQPMIQSFSDRDTEELFRTESNRRFATIARRRMILSPAIALILGACGGSDGLGPPSHPGPEKSKGEILQFGKNQHGEWITEKRYSEAQKKQLEEYEDHRRSEDFDEWLSQGRDCPGR